MPKPPNKRPGGARQSAAGQRLRGKSNMANKPKPGVGLGQNALTNFDTSGFIAGDAPTASFGAYNSGTTMQQTIRNTWLNTLDVNTRARVMNKMGYWTEGNRVTPRTLNKQEVAYYKAMAADVLKGSPGGMYQPQDASGAVIGAFTLGADGKVKFDSLGKRGGKKGGKNGGNGGGSGGTGGGGGAGGGGGGNGGGVGPPVPPRGETPPEEDVFSTGVSGSTGEFVTEKHKGPKGEAGDNKGTGDKRKHKAQRKKLVKRAVKKTNVKGKAIRKALRSEGVTKHDKAVYKKVAKQSNPKLSARLRLADRRNDKKKK